MNTQNMVSAVRAIQDDVISRLDADKRHFDCVLSAIERFSPEQMSESKFIAELDRLMLGVPYRREAVIWAIRSSGSIYTQMYDMVRTYPDGVGVMLAFNVLTVVITFIALRL